MYGAHPRRRETNRFRAPEANDADIDRGGRTRYFEYVVE